MPWTVLMIHKYGLNFTPFLHTEIEKKCKYAIPSYVNSQPWNCTSKNVFENYNFITHRAQRVNQLLFSVHIPPPTWTFLGPVSRLATFKALAAVVRGAFRHLLLPCHSLVCLALHASPTATEPFHLHVETHKVVLRYDPEVDDNNRILTLLSD